MGRVIRSARRYIPTVWADAPKIKAILNYYEPEGEGGFKNTQREILIDKSPCIKLVRWFLEDDSKECSIEGDFSSIEVSRRYLVSINIEPQEIV